MFLERGDNFINVCFFPYQFHEEYIQQDIFDSLTSLGPACLPSLSLHSCPGYIYLVEGKRSVQFEMSDPPNGQLVIVNSCSDLLSEPLNHLIAGVVTGVDEQTACCWLVCDSCENRDIRTLTSGAKYVLFMFSALIQLVSK